MSDNKLVQNLQNKGCPLRRAECFQIAKCLGLKQDTESFGQWTGRVWEQSRSRFVTTDQTGRPATHVQGGFPAEQENEDWFSQVFTAALG